MFAAPVRYRQNSRESPRGNTFTTIHASEGQAFFVHVAACCVSERSKARLPSVSALNKDRKMATFRVRSQLCSDVVPEAELRLVDPHLQSFINLNHPEGLAVALRMVPFCAPPRLARYHRRRRETTR